MSKPRRARIYCTYCLSRLRVKKTCRIQEPQSVRAGQTRRQGAGTSAASCRASSSWSKTSWRSALVLSSTVTSIVQAFRCQLPLESSEGPQLESKVVQQLLNLKSKARHGKKSRQIATNKKKTSHYTVQCGQKMSTGLSLNPASTESMSPLPSLS